MIDLSSNRLSDLYDLSSNKLTDWGDLSSSISRQICVIPLCTLMDLCDLSSLTWICVQVLACHALPASIGRPFDPHLFVEIRMHATHHTRNPKPEPRNPRPETRNPKPETRRPKPETPKCCPNAWPCVRRETSRDGRVSASHANVRPSPEMKVQSGPP